MDNSAETAPLLNDYKLEYFSRRLPQTISGGLKFKTGFKLPCSIFLSEVLVFLIPLLLSVVLTIPSELNNELQLTLTLVYGSVMFCISFLTHIALKVIGKKSDKRKGNFKFYSEDDELEFASCASLESMRYIFHKKHHNVNILLHSLVYGAVCGVSFHYLLPSKTKIVFGSSSASIAYYILGWLTVCIGQYSLIAQAPPEPAQYRTTDQLELLPLQRPFFVGCFAVIGILAM